MGNTIAGQNTPSSNRRSAKRCVTSASPVMTGVIGVCDVPVSNPSSARPSFNVAVFAHSRSSRSGSSRMTSERRDAGGVTAGGADVENR